VSAIKMRSARSDTATVSRALASAAVVLLMALAAAPARAGVANAALAGAPAANPLAGMPWGPIALPITDPGHGDPVSAYRNTAGGAERSLLSQLLAQPRTQWFGAWVRTGAIRQAVRRHIAAVTHGDGRVGVQLGVFRLVPFERAACRRLPTRAEQRDYKRWIAQFARGVGRTRTMIVLQPDLPFVRCLPGHSTIDMRLVAFAARRLSALPHTTVYLDAGAADWLSAGQAARMLRGSGVRYARGFALNLTHFDSTARQVAYGRRIVRALAHAGVRGKHVVVNTAQNGRPFIAWRHRLAFRRGTVCASRAARHCVTLGRPFTTRTAVPGVVDAYVWAGRPWINNATRRARAEVVQLVRSSPFF
jgi:hypothetical protein